MSKNKINKIAEEKAFDYQRGLGMIDSVSDDHIVARRMGFYDGFIAGAEWQADHAPLPEDTVLFQKGVEEGKRLMLEGAVEADVNTYRDLAAGKSWAEFVVKMPTKNLGDTVRIIVLKAEEE